MQSSMKIVLYTLWTLAALPLLAYPFTVTEAWWIISESSYYDGPARDALLAISVSVMWLAFPVVYFVGLYQFRRRVKKAPPFGPAVWMTALPVGYLIAFFLLATVWTLAEGATIDEQRRHEPTQSTLPPPRN